MVHVGIWPTAVITASVAPSLQQPFTADIAKCAGLVEQSCCTTVQLDGQLPWIFSVPLSSFLLSLIRAQEWVKSPSVGQALLHVDKLPSDTELFTQRATDGDFGALPLPLPSATWLSSPFVIHYWHFSHHQITKPRTCFSNVFFQFIITPSNFRSIFFLSTPPLVFSINLKQNTSGNSRYL